MAIAHDFLDRSGRFRIIVDEQRWAGMPTTYKVRVIDQTTHRETMDDEVYHSDADAACEGWAVVSLLLAKERIGFQGAYVIGATEY